MGTLCHQDFFTMTPSPQKSPITVPEDQGTPSSLSNESFDSTKDIIAEGKEIYIALNYVLWIIWNTGPTEFAQGVADYYGQDINCFILDSSYTDSPIPYKDPTTGNIIPSIPKGVLVSLNLVAFSGRNSGSLRNFFPIPARY